MSIVDTLKNIFGKHKDKLPEQLSVENISSRLPEDMNSVEDIKAKAADVLEQHADTIDQITDKIPGGADDQFVDKARELVGGEPKQQ